MTVRREASDDRGRPLAPPHFAHDRSFLLVGTGSPMARRQEFDLLVSGGEWIRAVRALTAAQDVETLAALATQEHPVLELIRSEHRQGVGQPQLGRGLPAAAAAHDLERACRATAALGAVLVDPSRDDLRDQAVTWFSRAPIPTDPERTVATFAGSHAAPYVEALRGSAGVPPPFAVALAAHLAGAPWPSPGGVRVAVLFDAGVEGRSGWLTLTSVPTIGPALLPHPAAMALFRADDRFAASVRQAWSLRPARHGVMWQLEDGLGSIDAVTGGSLGAAFAMALDELNALDAPGRRLVRLKRLGSPSVAVTGDIAATGRLVPVGGLDAKLSAATASMIRRVVIPSAPATTEAAPIRSGTTVEVVTADDLDAVLREVRRTDRRAVARASLAVLAVLAILLGAVGVTAIRSRDRTATALAASQREKEAKALLVEAGDLRSTDLRTSMLLTLESYRLDPLPATRNQLTEALGVGTSLLKVLPSTGRAKEVEAIRPIDGQDWVSAVLDDQGTITYRSTGSGKLLATVRSEDKPVTTMAANPVVPWMITAAGDTISQVAVPTFDGTGPVPSLTPGTCNGDGRPLLAMAPDGTSAAAVQGSTVCVWDLLTGERIAHFELFDVPMMDGAKDADGLATTVTALAFGGDAHTLLLGGTSQVARVDLRTWRQQVFSFDSGFDATSIAAYRSASDAAEHILATTSNQLFVKFEDQPAFEPVALPEANVRRVDANVDGSVILATLGREVQELDPANNFQPSKDRDAIAYRTADTTHPDLAIIDDYRHRAIAVLGDQPGIVLGSRKPAQQRASLGTYATGVSASDDGATVVTFTESSATPHRLGPHGQLSTGTVSSLDIPAKVAGKDMHLRDIVFPEAAHGDFIAYGFTYVGIGEDTVPMARLFDGKTLHPKRDLVLPSGPHRQLATVVDAGSELVVVDVSGHVTTFSTRTWKRLRSQRLPVDSPYAVAVSPSKRVLAVADVAVDDQGRRIDPTQGSISFYRYPALTPIGTPIRSPGDASWNVGFLDDTTLVAHAIDDHLYRFDSHRTTAGTTRWQASPLHIAGGKAAHWSAISPDRRKIAVASGPDISVFRASDMKSPEAVLSTGDEDVNLFLFTRGGRSLISKTQSGTAVWDLPTDDLEAQVCQVVGSGLTRDEWREHLAALPYVLRCAGSRTPDSETPTPDRSPAADDALEDSPADPIPARTRSCRDFASLHPASCTAYGSADRPFALVSITREENGATSATVTSWGVQHGRWEALGQLDDPYESVELHQVPITNGPRQATLMYMPGNYELTLVFDRGKVVFQTGSSRLSGSDLITEEPLHRGEQSNAGVSAAQRSVHRWNGKTWVLAGMAPRTIGFWIPDPKLLAPRAIAGVDPGGSYAAAVAAVDKTLSEAGTDQPAKTVRHWRDGLSETATQPWTERKPMDLQETCWTNQLCVDGDDAGRLVGWRYDGGQFRTAPVTSAPTADLLRLQEPGGLELTDDWQDVIDRWPSGSVTGLGGLQAVKVGVVHPRGAVTRADGSSTPLMLDPTLAGAVTTRSVTLGSTTVTLGFDADIQAAWNTSQGHATFTKWQGDGAMSIRALASGTSGAPLAALPGPGLAPWNLTLCASGDGLAISATGQGQHRAWTVTPDGLVQAAPGTGC